MLQLSQQGGSIIHGDFQIAVRMADIPAQGLGHHKFSDGFCSSDPYLPDLCLHQLLLEALLIVKGRTSVLRYPLGLRGGMKLSAIIYKQLAAVLILQAPDLLAYRRLAHAQLLPCFPVIHGLVQSQKGPDAIVHHGPSPL